MIFGITNKEDGTPIVRLTKAYKVSIGIPATGDRNYPEKSDHFHIRAKSGKGEWIDDKAFMAKLQEQYMPIVDTENGKVRPPLREFDIVFLSDDIEDVFRTEYAWWAASEKKCSGDGKDAKRSLLAIPEKERAQYAGQRLVPWKNCGNGCPELEKGLCKPTGELLFIFKDRPTMGAVAAYTTTSYESIRRIFSSLQTIQSVTGGRLKGIPFKIVVRPGKTRYEQAGQMKSGTAYFVNIEFRQDDYANLVPMLLEQSAKYERSLTVGRKMLAGALEDDDVVDVEVTPEHEKAKEMTSEFFPNNRDGRTMSVEERDKLAAGSGPGRLEPGVSGSDADMATINGLAEELSMNQAQRDVLFRTLRGEVDPIKKWLADFKTEVNRLAFSGPEIQTWLSRGTTDPIGVIVSLKENKPKSETVTEGTATRRKRTAHTPTPAATAPDPPQQQATEAPKEASAPVGTLAGDAGKWNW